MSETIHIDQSDSDRSWEKVVKKYNHPNLVKSIWQITNSLIPFIIMWFLMYKSLHYSYWITLLLCVIASGFLIRMFIIFHDCGHGSFFKSSLANRIVGNIMGIFAFTPYNKWHDEHKIHHATSSNLDKRGIGDVWTLTVDEYQNSSNWNRFVYRCFRNPYLLFILGPILIVFIYNRVTTKKMTIKEKGNIYFTNFALLTMAILMSMLIGIQAYLLIQIPLILIAQSMGLWLFYVQHQFDDTTWERNTKWDYKSAALEGSSFLKLPKVFQWFTGNIGFHHVHHLSSKIPNYNLARCHYENELFKDVKPLKIMSSFKTLHLSLWDEKNHQMISFKQFIALRLKSLNVSMQNLDFA